MPRQLCGYGRSDWSTKLIRGLTSETPAGFRSRRGPCHDSTLVAPHNAPFSTYKDELGHGWVAVGRLKSERYSDMNFTLSPNATNFDETIKPHEIIRARWSVSLRKNSRNLEDRQGYTGTSRGILWGGECAKVIDSRSMDASKPGPSSKSCSAPRQRSRIPVSSGAPCQASVR